MKKLDEKMDINDLKQVSHKQVYDFQQFQTKRFFSDSIFNGTTSISAADKKTKQFIRKYFNSEEKSQRVVNR